MATTSSDTTSSPYIRSLIPARIDRLPWSRFHTRLIIALGVAWILDGLEITIAANVGSDLTLRNTLNMSAGAVSDIAWWYLIGEVIGALVTNAPHGPDDTGWVEVAIRQDAATVEITVRDNGPGVPEELRGTVFEQGWSSKAETGPDAERGFGLALTRLVCQRRGGEISLAPGTGGAAFTAWLGVEPSAEMVR